MNDTEILQKNPAQMPSASLLWTAIVEVGARQDLGIFPGGQRFMIPITGGRFYSDQPSLNGTVLPGGADRQLLRPDGVKELDALYEMEATDGSVLTIQNRVLVDDSRTPDRYAMSHIAVQAPDGPLAWLNRRFIVGTLQSLRPERDAVVIRAWLMDNQ